MRLVTEPTSPASTLVELEPRHDDRGFFARTFDRHGVRRRRPGAASSRSATSRSTTTPGRCAACTCQLRRHPEAKLVRCTRGAIFDVDRRPAAGLPDLPAARRRRAERREPARRCTCRRTSRTATRRSPTTPRSLYQVSGPYTPGAERGLRHDDPALGIEWPLPVAVSRDKDASWPLFDAEPDAERLRRRAVTTGAPAVHRVIIVDNALAQRPGRGTPAPGRPWSAPASWAAGWPTRSSTASRAWSSSPIANRTVDQGARAIAEAGVDDAERVETRAASTGSRSARASASPRTSGAAHRGRPGRLPSSTSPAPSSSARDLTGRGDRRRQARS